MCGLLPKPPIGPLIWHLSSSHWILVRSNFYQEAFSKAIPQRGFRCPLGVLTEPYVTPTEVLTGLSTSLLATKVLYFFHLNPSG